MGKGDERTVMEAWTNAIRISTEGVDEGARRRLEMLLEGLTEATRKSGLEDFKEGGAILEKWSPRVEGRELFASLSGCGGISVWECPTNRRSGEDVEEGLARALARNFFGIAGMEFISDGEDDEKKWQEMLKEVKRIEPYGKIAAREMARTKERKRTEERLSRELDETLGMLEKKGVLPSAWGSPEVEIKIVDTKEKEDVVMLSSMRKKRDVLDLRGMSGYSLLSKAPFELGEEGDSFEKIWNEFTRKITTYLASSLAQDEKKRMLAAAEKEELSSAADGGSEEPRPKRARI